MKKFKNLCNITNFKHYISLYQTLHTNRIKQTHLLQEELLSILVFIYPRSTYHIVT